MVALVLLIYTEITSEIQTVCLVCVTSPGGVLQLVHSPSQIEVEALEGQVIPASVDLDSEVDPPLGQPPASVDLDSEVDPPLGQPMVVRLRNAGGVPCLQLVTVGSPSPPLVELVIPPSGGRWAIWYQP